MDESERKRKERRRRTCIDEIRRNLARQQARRSDPAGKVVLQILALLSAGLALAPAFGQKSYVQRDRRQPPPGYDLGPAAWARERGLEPEDDIEFPAVPEPRLRPMPRPLPNCSWSRLVKDLRRRSTSVRARELIEQRIPSEALPWLRNLILEGDWSALRMIGMNADPELIRDRALAAAAAADLLERHPDLALEHDVDSVSELRP